LLKDSTAHQRYSISHGHGFHLVVCNVYCRSRQFFLKSLEFGLMYTLNFASRLLWFVEQEDLGMPNDSPSQGDSLGYPSTDLLRFPIQKRLKPKQLSRFLHLFLNAWFWDFSHFERERHVIKHRHMRV
jgi:hypothetical protein